MPPREGASVFVCFSKVFYLFSYLFLERREQKEKKREKHPCVVASCTPPTGDLARNPGKCLDGESNQQPFSPQAGVQPTEPHRPGHFCLFLFLFFNFAHLLKSVIPRHQMIFFIFA